MSRGAIVLRVAGSELAAELICAGPASFLSFDQRLAPSDQTLAHSGKDTAVTLRAIVLAMLVGLAVPSASRAGWTLDGAPLVPGPGVQIFRDLIPDRAGGAFFEWEQGAGYYWQVSVIRVDALGNVVPGWPRAGLPVFDPLLNLLTGETLLYDDQKHLYVAWTVRQNAGKTVEMLHCLDAIGGFAPGWPAGGLRIASAVGVDFQSHLVSDGQGGVIAVWGPVTPIEGIDCEIRAQRIDAQGGLHWGDFGRTIVPSADDLIGPALVSDGAGGAILAWSSGRSEQSQIYALRLTADGDPAPGWPATGVAMTTAAGNRQLGAMVSDGAGGVILGWSESRGATGTAGQDVYAQHLLATGKLAPGWGADGNVVCAAPANQMTPLMCGDGAGGAVLAWNDFRPGASSTGIFAQRIDGVGHLLWATAGVAVCTAPDVQRLGALSSDGKGGAWTAWEDWRNGYADSDIYGTHLFADGGIDPEFAFNGTPACSAPGIQYLPMLAVDPGFKPVVAWPDERFTFPATQIFFTVLMDPSEFPQPGPEPTPSEIPVLKRAFLSHSRSAQVEFRLPGAGMTRLELFDVSGRRVAASDLGWMPAGDHQAALNGLEDRPPGVYLVRLSQGTQSWTSRVALIR